MSEKCFVPFNDDATVLRLGELTLENGQSSILMAGAIEFGHDAHSKDRVRSLIEILKKIEEAIDIKSDNGFEVTLRKVEKTVKNPFN